MRCVAKSLAILLLVSILQAIIFIATDSVALLADLIHNVGDALTAVPLGIAFFLRSRRGETAAGYGVIAALLISATVALYESVTRLADPPHVANLWVLALGGMVGFLGNEWAAQIRLRTGRRLSSPALIADGNHARVDGFVSLGVVASAGFVGAGVRIMDPVISLLITAVILKVTLDSWRTLRNV